MNSLFNSALKQSSAVRRDLDAFAEAPSTSSSALQGQISASLTSLSRTIDDYYETAKKELILSKQEKAYERLKTFRAELLDYRQSLDRLKMAREDSQTSQNRTELLGRRPHHTSTPENPYAQSALAANSPFASQSNKNSSLSLGTSPSDYSRETHALREQSFMSSTNAQLDEYLERGRAVLGDLGQQREILKGTQRKLYNVANTLGVSGDTIRRVERRAKQDNRAPPPPQVEDTEGSASSLVDVDSPHVSSVSSDYNSQSTKTQTQADRLAREADDRARTASKNASEVSRDASRKASDYSRDASNKASEISRDASSKAKDASKRASEVTRDARSKASDIYNHPSEYSDKASEKASDYSQDASNIASEFSEDTSKNARNAGNKASNVSREAVDKASDIYNHPSENYDRASKKASDLAHKAEDKASDIYNHPSENFDKAKKVAAEKSEQAKEKAVGARDEISANKDNPVVVGNAVAILAIGGALGFGAYNKYVAGDLSWRIAGLWAGAVGIFAVGDYYVSQYLFRNKYPKK